jgi:hypothetical protein
LALGQGGLTLGLLDRLQERRDRGPIGRLQTGVGVTDDAGGIKQEDGTLPNLLGRPNAFDTAYSEHFHTIDPFRILAQAAASIGDMQVRNRGTIGGSLAQADPHGDLPTVLLALDGEVSAEGPDGVRTIAASDLFLGFLTTSLRPDEILTGVRVPKAPKGAYVKFNRRAQDWAIVGVAAVVDGSSARIALTGVGPAPVRAEAAERAFSGGNAAEAAELAAEGLDPPADSAGSADFGCPLPTRFHGGWKLHGEFAEEIRGFCSRVHLAQRSSPLQPDSHRQMIVVKHQVRLVYIERRGRFANPDRAILRPSECSKRKDNRHSKQSTRPWWQQRPGLGVVG